MPTDRPFLTANEALNLLHTQDCVVRLHIAMGVYETNHNDTCFELIYVDEFGGYVHFHNIKAIKCLNIDTADPEAEFIPIDWTTETR